MAKFVWKAKVDKSDLLEAIGYVRTRTGLKLAKKLDPNVLIASTPDGLSFRSGPLACDILAERAWPSPVTANGPVMRSLAPKLSGAEIELRYESGKLWLNTTQIPAKEV